MAEPRIDVDGLPFGVSGPYDTVVGVDEATGAARRFPMPQAGTPRSYATRASLPAASGFSEGYTVWVNNDPTPANNGTWAVLGGAWVQSADRVTQIEQSKLSRGDASSPVARAGSAPWRYSNSRAAGYSVSSRPEVVAINNGTSGKSVTIAAAVSPGNLLSWRELVAVSIGKVARASFVVGHMPPTGIAGTVEFGVSWYGGGAAASYLGETVVHTIPVFGTASNVAHSFSFGSGAEVTPIANAYHALPFVRVIGTAGTLLVLYFDVEDEAKNQQIAELESRLALADLSSGKAGSILLAAKRDGWHALYNPDSASSKAVESREGSYFITEIADSLGNAGPVRQLVQSRQPEITSDASSLVLADHDGTVLANADDGRFLYSQPFAILVLAGRDPLAPTGNVVDSATGTVSQRVAIQSTATGWNFWAGANVPVSDSQSGLSLLVGVFNGAISKFSVNGVIVSEANPGANNMLGVSIGGRDYPSFQSPHAGAVGPVLIFNGELTDEKRERMERLILGLTGFKPDLPALTTIGGHATSDAGDVLRADIIMTPDAAGNSGSTIKMLTALTLASTGMSLDTVVDVDADDDSRDGSTANIQAGDLLTMRDLVYGMALPSGNDAAHCIARHAGQYLLDLEGGTGNPRNRFIAEMNAFATTNGISSTSAANAYSTGLTTARSLCKMIRMIYDSPTLRAIFGAQSRLVTVTGPNARTYTITHTIDAAQLPGFICGKTGAGGNLAVAWEFEGDVFFSAVKESSSDANRIPDMAAMMAYIKRKSLVS